MAALVEIKFDEAKLRKVQGMLRDIPRALPRVMSRAINKTATSAKTDVARRIAGEVNIKISTIKKNITLKRATYRVWQAVLGIWTKRIPLINFAARQTAKGVSYKISKTEGRKTIKSAFIISMSSGHRGVFRRAGPGRLPIIELKGPSVGEVFRGSAGLAQAATRQAQQRLGRNIDDQVKLALARWRAGAKKAG